MSSPTRIAYTLNKDTFLYCTHSDETLSRVYIKDGSKEHAEVELRFEVRSSQTGEGTTGEELESARGGEMQIEIRAWRGRKGARERERGWDGVIEVGEKEDIQCGGGGVRGN